MSSIVSFVGKNTEPESALDSFMQASGREFASVGRRLVEGAKQTREAMRPRIIARKALMHGALATDRYLHDSLGSETYSEIARRTQGKSFREKAKRTGRALVEKKLQNPLYEYRRVKKDLKGKGLLGAGAVLGEEGGSLALRTADKAFNGVGRFLLDRTALGENEYGRQALDWVSDTLRRRAEKSRENAKLTREQRAELARKEKERLAKMSPEARLEYDKQIAKERAAKRHKLAGFIGGLANSAISRNIDTSSFLGKVYTGITDKISDAHAAKAERMGYDSGAPRLESPKAKPAKLKGPSASRASLPPVSIDNSELKGELSGIGVTLESKLGDLQADVKKISTAITLNERGIARPGGISTYSSRKKDKKKERDEVRRRTGESRIAKRRHDQIVTQQITKKDFRRSIKAITGHLEEQGKGLKRLGRPLKSVVEGVKDKALKKGGGLLGSMFKMMALGKMGGLLKGLGPMLAGLMGGIGAGGLTTLLAGAAAIAAPIATYKFMESETGQQLRAKMADTVDSIMDPLHGKRGMKALQQTPSGDLLYDVGMRRKVTDEELGKIKSTGNAGNAWIVDQLRYQEKYKNLSNEELQKAAQNVTAEEMSQILESNYQIREQRRASARQGATVQRQDGVTTTGAIPNPTGPSSVGQKIVESARQRVNQQGADYILGAGHWTDTDPLGNGNKYDCSSLVGWSTKSAGVDVKGIAPATAEMKQAYTKAGFTYYKKHIDKHNLDFLQPGDILLRDYKAPTKPGGRETPGHTVVYSGNGNIIGAHGARVRGQHIGEKPLAGSYDGFFRWEKDTQNQPQQEQEMSTAASQPVARQDGMQVGPAEMPAQPISTQTTGPGREVAGTIGPAPSQPVLPQAPQQTPAPQNGVANSARNGKKRRRGRGLTHAEQFANNPRSQQAIDYFMSQGWTREQAIGIAANLGHESGYKTGAEGDKGYKGGSSYGIAQWREGRVDKFKRIMGKHPTEASYEEQLQFVQWELQNTHTKAAREMRNATTAADAAAAMTVHYEIPKDRFNVGRARGRTAAQMEEILYGSQAPQGVPSKASAGLDASQNAQGAKGLVDNASNTALDSASIKAQKAAQQPIVVPVQGNNSGYTADPMSSRASSVQDPGPMSTSPEPGILTQLMLMEMSMGI